MPLLMGFLVFGASPVTLFQEGLPPAFSERDGSYGGIRTSTKQFQYWQQECGATRKVNEHSQREMAKFGSGKGNNFTTYKK